MKKVLNTGMKRYTNTQWKKIVSQKEEIFEKIDHNKLWNNENVDNKSYSYSM